MSYIVSIIFRHFKNHSENIFSGDLKGSHVIICWNLGDSRGAGLRWWGPGEARVSGGLDKVRRSGLLRPRLLHSRAWVAAYEHASQFNSSLLPRAVCRCCFGFWGFKVSKTEEVMASHELTFQFGETRIKYTNDA